MIKLNFNFILKYLDGTEIQEAKANHILANLVVDQTKGDSIKLLNWGLELYNNGVLNLDNSDLLTLKTIIEETLTLKALAKAQLLNQLIKHL